MSLDLGGIRVWSRNDFPSWRKIIMARRRLTEYSALALAIGIPRELSEDILELHGRAGLKLFYANVGRRMAAQLDELGFVILLGECVEVLPWESLMTRSLVRIRSEINAEIANAGS